MQTLRLATSSRRPGKHQIPLLRGGNLTPILTLEGKKHRVSTIKNQVAISSVEVDGTRFDLELLREITSKPPVLLVRVGHRVISVSAQELADEGEYAIEINGRKISARLEDASLESSTESKTVQGPILVKSPMAGKIAAVKTSLGAIVEEGQALIMLEAMKMENEIAAPKRGTIKEIYVQTGALAKPGEKLVLIE